MFRMTPPQGASCDHPGCLAVVAPLQSCMECQRHPTVCPHTLVNARGPGPSGRVSENMPERPYKAQCVDHTVLRRGKGYSKFFGAT